MALTALQSDPDLSVCFTEVDPDRLQAALRDGLSALARSQQASPAFVRVWPSVASVAVQPGDLPGGLRYRGPRAAGFGCSRRGDRRSARADPGSRRRAAKRRGAACPGRAAAAAAAGREPRPSALRRRRPRRCCAAHGAPRRGGLRSGSDHPRERRRPRTPDDRGERTGADPQSADPDTAPRAGKPVRSPVEPTQSGDQRAAGGCDDHPDAADWRGLGQVAQVGPRPGPGPRQDPSTWLCTARRPNSIARCWSSSRIL